MNANAFTLNIKLNITLNVTLKKTQNTLQAEDSNFLTTLCTS